MKTKDDLDATLRVLVMFSEKTDQVYPNQGNVCQSDLMFAIQTDSGRPFAIQTLFVIQTDLSETVRKLRVDVMFVSQTYTYWLNCIE